ncbi:MAG: pentapeptide repeat-containing protein [Candidatus Acidiferrum sp.]|jgi:hypothetical protein
MRIRIHRERPDPWSVRRQRIKHVWTTPFWAFEWILDWIAFALSRWTFLDVLEYLEGFSVLIAVIFYFSESGDRLKQKHYQAWQVINTAQGKGGSGGRIEALQELNHDGVPLVGVDVSGAFLQNLYLEHARLLRSNFSSADLRDSTLDFADFSDADLHSANFRGSHLQGAAFQRADLQETDLTGADLSGADLSGATLTDADLTDANLANLHWRDLASVKNANLHGVRNAPEGFVPWAKQHGAVQTQSDPQQ